MTDTIIDKKYWVEGWWCKDYAEAIKIAEREGRWRISWTPDKPRDLKLIAVKRNGKWYTDRIRLWWFRNRYDS